MMRFIRPVAFFFIMSCTSAAIYAVEFRVSGAPVRNAQAHTEASIDYDGDEFDTDPDASSGPTSAYASSEVEAPGSAYAQSWSAATNHIWIVPAQPGKPATWNVSSFGHYLGHASVSIPKWFSEAWAWHQVAISQSLEAETTGTWRATMKFSQVLSADKDVVARYYMTAFAGRSTVTWSYNWILDEWQGSGTIWTVQNGVESSEPYIDSVPGFEFTGTPILVSENITAGESITIGTWINGDDPWDLSWLVAYLLADALWASGENNESGYARHDVQVVLEDTP